MLKSFLRDRNISLYKLSKASGVPYSTLNDLANSKLTVDNIKSGQLKAMADALDIDMDSLYEICRVTKFIRSKRYGIEAGIVIEHKAYHINFVKDGREYECELLPVRREATAYLETLAEWKLDEQIEEIEMEAAYETLCAKTAR